MPLTVLTYAVTKRSTVENEVQYRTVADAVIVNFHIHSGQWESVRPKWNKHWQGLVRPLELRVIVVAHFTDGIMTMVAIHDNHANNVV